MPNIGILFVLSSLMHSIAYLQGSGSPGPLERNTPSGFIAIISAAVVLAGTTITLNPLSLSIRKMLCFTPKSIATIFKLLSSKSFLQEGSFHSYTFFVETTEARSFPPKGTNSSINLSAFFL